MEKGTDMRSRSWFVTIWAKSMQNMDLSDLLDENNFPKDGTGKELVEQIREIWACSGKGRTSGATACVSADGKFHIHMGVYSPNPMQMNVVANILGKSYVTQQRGTKEQLIKYIKKDGDFAEKGEVVLYESDLKGIQDNQGRRNDFAKIEELVKSGATPEQIYDSNFEYRRYEKMIKGAYFSKRLKETPTLRDVKVIWHVGESGSGKSYTYVQLCELYGEDNIYLMSDYEQGGLDGYIGQPVLFMDEFRGQIRFSTLLCMLQGYKQQFHARYSNIWGLWNEVHITSVLPPEKMYEHMVSENRDIDTIKQLLRRINLIIYHYKDGEKYKRYAVNSNEYTDYESLVYDATGNKFEKISEDYQYSIPFD